MPNKTPIHERVKGSADKQDVKRSGKEALSLEIAFRGLKAGVAWGADEDNLKVSACKDGNVMLGDDASEYRFGTEPDDGDGDGDGPEKVAGRELLVGALRFGEEGVLAEYVHHPLGLQTDQLFVT